MEYWYRIGVCIDKKWKYIIVDTKEEMLAEVDDKACLADRITIKKIERISLKEKEGNN